jgi:glutamate dehydrogenase
VHDVLDRLRACARREAQLLFREQKRSPCPLPKASERVSHAINSVTDAVAAVLGSASEQQREEYTELLLPLFREHLPKVNKPLNINR